MQSEPVRLSIGKASKYLGVSIDTLRRWEKKGKVVSHRSPGGHRYFLTEELDKVFGKKYERYLPEKKEETKPAEKITRVKEEITTPTTSQPQPPTSAYAVVEQIKNASEPAEVSQKAHTPIPDPTPAPPSPTPQLSSEQESRQTLEKKAKEIIDSHQPKYPEVQTTPPKKDTSWTKIFIIALILFVIVDIILFIIYFFSSRPLLSPIP